MSNTVSASRVIATSSEQLFELLADPAMHPTFDGSGTVRAPRPRNPARLSKGAKFYMSMRIGVPYRVYNVVTEFDEGRRIAWGHLGHTWRYELEPVDGGTKVTETWDYGAWKSAGKLFELLGFTSRNRVGIDATLQRLSERFGA